MSTATVQLEAGGLAVLPSPRGGEGFGVRGDADAAEQVVARTYRHPALGDRPVIRLASDRLGQAEDLAMEFLGFEAPAVSPPIALQQRRSLGFAVWALTNDPKNARFALDLVKRMKKAGRQAKSKPGHAWDAFTEMAKELGRSAPHFLPPFWEEAGRTYKDLGNETYAGRALTKSLEAERVHALESDRARRRDVVLEFVLSGCLAGSALSEYSTDLQSQYAPAEAFAIFRDLCVRRTRGGMAPWATMPKDFAKLAKAAELDADAELERWLDEVIEAPAMGRAALQFWKTCSSHCQRIVARNPTFAVALLRHTRPEERHYGESKLGPWFELLEAWGVCEYLWEDGYHGAPPLGEPIAHWFGRIVRDDVPAPKRTLEMLQKLAPRLKKEGAPLPLSVAGRFGHANAIDIDVLEACLVLGIKVDDPPPGFSVTFAGWLAANVDHPLRNQDVVESWKDERFKAAAFRGLEEALACRGGTAQRGYRQANLEQRAFPLAAGDRPGIKAAWRAHAADLIAALEASGLASFQMAFSRLEATLWPDTLRLFPDLAERLHRVDPVAMLQRTLQAGVFDEYGWPALEEAVDKGGVKVTSNEYGHSNIHLTFPSIAVADKIHAHVIRSDGTIRKFELRLPKKAEVTAIVVIGDDLAMRYNENYIGRFCWASDPAQSYDAGYAFFSGDLQQSATMLKDGSVFLGQQAVRPGDKQMPASQPYLHDGERFWRVTNEYDQTARRYRWKVGEVDPQTGKQLRESVPPWFEETDGGTIAVSASELMPAPAGAESSPLGVKDGMLGWKCVERRDGSYFGQGIDGRRWDRPLIHPDGTSGAPIGLLRQPATNAFLPLTISISSGRASCYWLWDPAGSTVVARLQSFQRDHAHGQVGLLPLRFWHLLKIRDEASSLKLREISQETCAALFKAAAADRATLKGPRRGVSLETSKNPLPTLLPAVKKLLPGAPERMALGIAREIERAEGSSDAFIALRDKMSAEANTEGTSSTLIDSHKTDMAATHWGLEAFHTYGHEAPCSISAHLAGAAAFLRGESKAGDLPRTNFLWFSMLENLPLRAWQTFWRATAAKMNLKDGGEVPWLEFLKLWHESGIAELPGQFDLMHGHPEGAKKTQWGGFDVKVVGGTSFTIANGADRFIAIERNTHDMYGMPYHFLRYSTAAEPGTLPGYTLKQLRKIKAKYDPAQIAAFIAAAEACASLPLPLEEELAEVARKLSTSPAEIGLIWMGGLCMDTYQANFLPAELRNALGWKTTDASAARQALRNLNPAVLASLYEAVVAPGCAAPFAADRAPVFRSIEKVWQAKMPRRLQLDAALQKRLSALGRTLRWQHLNHEELLAVASDPASHPLLQPREIEIKVEKNYNHGRMSLAGKNKNDPVASGASIRSIVQLVALVHAETAAGNPARAAMPALIEQTTKLLDHPSTLLELRGVFLYDMGRKKPPTPTEWINQHVGKTKANAKDATARYEDRLIEAAALDSQHQVLIAFRPVQLKAAEELARLQGILAIDAGIENSGGGSCLPVVAVVKSAGFQKLLQAILAKDVPEGQRPQNPVHTAADVVKAIRKKLKLSEEAAILYAQVLALPDPTAANVCMWNGWTTAQFKKAAAELVSGKLVLEASRARAGRSIFLPGEWAELKAPWLPIETWKYAHLVELDANPREPCPVGGPLVLRPFEDLFAAAWQRVLNGDAPRYEEVKRKKKAK